jgi:release factor glutamine methyltransferase
VFVRNALQEIPERITGETETPVLDAQVLLAHIMGKTRTWIIAHPDAPLSKGQREHLQQATKRLELGEPLPYVLGHWEFYGLDFKITSDVLIPRPETELLVDQALTWLNKFPGRRFAADIGTGSGCIAVSLAVNAKNLVVMASDISLSALKVAQQNVNQHNVTKQVFPVTAYLFPPIRKRFDLICANLPYIPLERLPNLKVFGKEPDLALDGGILGLKLIEKILQEAPQYLSEGGIMLLEIDSSQGEIIKNLATYAFPNANVNIMNDLTGKARLVFVQTRDS